MTALIVGLCGCGFIGTVAYREGVTLCAASAGAAVTALWLGVPL